MGQINGKPIPETGLRTNGLIFEDALDLSYISDRGQALPPLWLDGAQIRSHARFDDARLAMISLEGAEAHAGLSLQRIHTLGSAWFDRLNCRGGLSLMGAEIGGQLTFEGANLRGELDSEGLVAGPALSADRMTVEGGVFCGPAGTQRFEAVGEVRLLSADIGGILNLSGALLKATIDADGKTTGNALTADAIVVKRGVVCNPAEGHRFQSEGEVRFLGAKIDGLLSFCGASMRGPVDLDGRVVGHALALDGAEVTYGMFCNSAGGHRFEANGELHLMGANIGGQFVLRGARLTAPTGSNSDTGRALSAERIRVADATFLDGGIEIQGSVMFRGATFSELSLAGIFQVPSPGEGIALDLRDTEIRRLIVRFDKNAGRGRIHLEGARVDTIDKLDPASWGPAPDGNGGGLEVDIDGFTYRRAEISTNRIERSRTWARFLVRDPIAENVLELLDRGFRGDKPCQAHYWPQPFEQAVKALREAGYGRAADAVAVAKREFHRRCQADGPVTAFMSAVSLTFFRYGYGPLRASAWTIGLVLLGAGGVWLGQAFDILVTVPELGETAERCMEVPLSFALDTFLPLVDFGVETRCRVATAAEWGGVAESFRVAYAIAGWLFIPMVALTFSGLLRRD